MINSAPAGWSTRIGIYGRWGTGKTSVLNFLRQMQEECKNLVVSLSAWNADGSLGVIDLLYESLRDSLTEKNIDAESLGLIKSFVQQLAKVARGAGADRALVTGLNVAAPGVGSSAQALGSLALSSLRISRKDVDELVGVIHKNGFQRVVVFIDDLDRADPRLLPKALLSLRELLDWPDFVFVLSFDKDIVANALGEYSKSYGEAADRFIEKIVDVSFLLPTPSQRQMRQLSSRILAECCSFIPEETRDLICGRMPPNPRTAKLIARTLGSVREVATRHGPDEIDWYALAIQCVLRIVAPRLSLAIEREFLGQDFVVFKSLGTSFLDNDQVNLRIQGLVDSLSPSDSSSEFKSWLTELVGAVREARLHHSDERISYEMGLLTTEPAFTYRELRSLIERWDSDRISQNIAEEIRAASERGHCDVGDAAESLIVMSLKAYSQSLGNLAHSLDTVQYEACLYIAKRTLSFLCYLFDQDTHLHLLGRV
ncbi:KAP family P-loop NTPase fold protein [Ahniella affigens]|uniref:KAP family P-loop NTPase fold protein n=1 Tax=Ahniella affigens TaxID=2021234 RepID=UPI0014734444|nr:P-loop NTPase fold protein [Ahniella affigens]